MRHTAQERAVDREGATTARVACPSCPGPRVRRPELLELLDRLDPNIDELSQAIAQEAERMPEVKLLMTLELRFASFPRSIVRDPGRLSRVEMNALGAPLTASQDLTVMCANFPLDEAEDFIDE